MACPSECKRVKRFWMALQRFVGYPRPVSCLELFATTFDKFAISTASQISISSGKTVCTVVGGSYHQFCIIFQVWWLFSNSKQNVFQNSEPIYLNHFEWVNPHQNLNDLKYCTSTRDLNLYKWTFSFSRMVFSGYRLAFWEVWAEFFFFSNSGFIFLL